MFVRGIFVGFVGERLHECMCQQACRARVSAIDVDLKVQIFVQPRGAHFEREGPHAIVVRPDTGAADIGCAQPSQSEVGALKIKCWKVQKI